LRKTKVLHSFSLRPEKSISECKSDLVFFSKTDFTPLCRPCLTSLRSVENRHFRKFRVFCKNERKNEFLSLLLILLLFLYLPLISPSFSFPSSFFRKQRKSFPQKGRKNFVHCFSYENRGGGVEFWKKACYNEINEKNHGKFPTKIKENDDHEKNADTCPLYQKL
jgi:hypothetical protein